MLVNVDGECYKCSRSLDVRFYCFAADLFNLHADIKASTSDAPGSSTAADLWVNNFEGGNFALSTQRGKAGIVPLASWTLHPCSCALDHCRQRDSKGRQGRVNGYCQRIGPSQCQQPSGAVRSMREPRRCVPANFKTPTILVLGTGQRQSDHPRGQHFAGKAAD